MVRTAPAHPSRPLHAAALAAALLSAFLASPAAHANDGGHAAPAKPATAKPAAVAAPVAAPADELQRRLQERIATVRAAHAQVQALAPSRVHRTAHAAQRAAPALAMGIISPPQGAAPEAQPAHAATHAAHWSYGGEGGPAEWAKLRPDFSTCSTGQRQSPIDIRGGIKVELEPIKFSYRPTGFNVLDNGHTVQANLGLGNSIEVGGRRYDLVQFHFHRPSEERINGKQFEMVAHLVHKDPEGRLAVVAVLMDQGKQHPMVQLVWNSLPLEKNDELPSPVPIDMNLLLPEDRRYYTYMGSLTTPPCSEGVLWLVLKQPAQLSADQLAVFSRLYPMNARPIQQASGRMVKESN